MKTDQILYYSQRAKEYEKIYDLPERQYDLRRIKEFLEVSFTNKEVFEIACGTGYWTQYISETVKSIFSTDINESVLDIARSKKYACPVKIQNADVFNLSNLELNFNSGFAGFIWSHILKQELTQFLNQFLLKINKNGFVVFVDNTYVKGNSTPLCSTDKYGNSFQKRKLKDGKSYTVIKNYPTDSEMKALINPIGKNIKIIRMEYYWILKFNKK